MNDFTKDELQSFLWAIGYVRERTNNCGDKMRSLRTKIQSMIDNYCEHHPSLQCSECGSFICKHCERIYPE